MRRLPPHVVVSFLAVHAIAIYVIVRCLTTDGHVGRFVTASAAVGLAIGATAGLFRRTWGIGLVLTSAASFFVAGALDMGPPFFYLVAAVGGLPFLLTVRHMARFDVRATLLFALGAALLGLGCSLAWGALAPTVIPMFGHY